MDDGMYSIEINQTTNTVTGMAELLRYLAGQLEAGHTFGAQWTLHEL